MDSKILPDQIHIEQIKKRLWCGRELGQAAVMIGAGFSKNADKTFHNASSFPLWQQLAYGMYDTLYPSNSSSTDDRLRATSGGEVLKLALEYETIFGRSALDNYLLESIDDSGYQPGELHKLLLSLPWSDVFTTNYDTLLERTQIHIYERKYDLVETFSDMPVKMKPRIVKLNGSFPSHRPFIITEEDFRTYPKKFAPFVNMVQQSMMENAFCLLGFSGDDPNFLSWSGWIRDNLGESKPPIYLCGLLELELSPSKRKLLENKGIIPIDLSPLFPKYEFPENIRHKEAIKWFLKELQKGKPLNPMEWPKVSKERCRTPLFKPSVDDLTKTCEIWNKDRSEYPGWIIAPKVNRSRLWDCTKAWIGTIFDFNEILSDTEKLFLLHELNWRLEKALVPLSSKEAEIINLVLEKFNPFPSYMEIPTASIKADQTEHKKLDWERIRESWVELAFVLVRESRENHNEEQFTLWINRLGNLQEIKKDWKVRLYYEKCLFSLFRLNQEEVRECLDSWTQIDDLPFWETKRASIFAELGDLYKAEEIAERALQNIRSQIRPYEIDCLTLSQEGWTMYLLKQIKWNSNIRMKKGINIKNLDREYGDRWDKLEIYRCNPDSHIESLYLNVERVQLPIPENEMTYSNHLTYATIPAFSFLRMFEEIGLPIRCGFIMMYPNSVAKSSYLIASYSPLWALSSIVRTGSNEEINKWFDQVQVALFTPDEINHFYELFTNSLRQTIKYLNLNPQECKTDSYSVNRAKVASNILSRICMRLSVVQRDQLFRQAVDMYKMQIFRESPLLYDCIENIFSKLLFSMPQSEIIEKIPDLLSLPIPTEKYFEVNNTENWPEPILYVEWIDKNCLGPNFDKSLWTEHISNLITIAKSGSQKARNVAVLRLLKIYEINGLDSAESKLWAEALWGRLNSITGLPDETQLLTSSFLLLPEIKEGVAKENFHKYLLSQDFKRILLNSQTPDGKVNKRFMGLGTEINEWFNGTISVFPWKTEENEKLEDWTLEETVRLLDKAISWWNEEKYEVNADVPYFVSFFPKTVKEQFSHLVQLISEVILPRLGPASKDVKVRVKNLLSEMEQYEICVLSTLPMTLYFEPENYDEVSQKIRFGLNSVKEEEVRETIRGLFRWVLLGNIGKIPSPPNDLLDELINRAVMRRQPGLKSVISCISGVVKELPQLINEKQTESLIIALQYLIKETELLDKKSLCKIDNHLISINELPEYRKTSAKLSYWVFQKLKSENKTIPPIISDWKEACMKDPFPQVRKIWT